MNKRRIFFTALFCSCFLCLQATHAKAENKMKAKAKADRQNSIASPFGVLEFLHWDHQWNNYKYATYVDLNKAVALMKEAGVAWVRMDFLWSDIEPERDNFDFNKYDYLVSLLYRNNINILGILDYTTD
ncbi:MAG: beta-galactosidase, partial [Candidatus Omnitrophica bacterium]|nr:beta-galactosidase [Candidatus Omnitrophota bacterium]